MCDINFAVFAPIICVNFTWKDKICKRRWNVLFDIIGTSWKYNNFTLICYNVLQLRLKCCILAHFSVQINLHDESKKEDFNFFFKCMIYIKKTLFTLNLIEYIFVYRIPQLTVYTKILYLLMVSKSKCFFFVTELNLNENATERIEKKSNG